MEIRINGKSESLNAPKSLLALVQEKGFKEDRIVVEHNMVIIPKDKWSTVKVDAKDIIEIVSFVGGG